jgi:hypothetical protein
MKQIIMPMDEYLVEKKMIEEDTYDCAQAEAFALIGRFITIEPECINLEEFLKCNRGTKNYKATFELLLNIMKSSTYKPNYTNGEDK